MLLACGCARDEVPAPDPEALQGAIFVLLDTVRADHLSSSGYARKTSPNLEALAERGVVFEQVISYAPWTLPSMVALLSARWGSRPGVFESGRLRLSLVESIRDAGFATAAFTEGAFVSRSFGFDLGFDDYVEEEGVVQRLLPGEQRDATAAGSIERTFERAFAWLAENAHRRFFLFVHSYEPHTPYTRKTFTGDLPAGAVGATFEREQLALLRSGALAFDENDLRYLSALYDGGIREGDRYIGKLVAQLERLGLASRTLLVVSSDHGEDLGEHASGAIADHGHSLYDDQLRVPLIISDPRAGYPVARVIHQVRTIDVLPTIADLLGVELGAEDAAAGPATPVQDGRSLLPFMRAAESGDRMAFGGATRELPARSFVRYRGYKYIETKLGSRPLSHRPAPPAQQLYDLRRDPSEQQNLVDSQPELTERYRAWLGEHLREQQADPGTPELESIPDALRERLRSLGYFE